MKISKRDIGGLVAGFALGAAAVTGIDRIAHQPQPKTQSAQTVQATPQKRLTDFYLTQGVEQPFIYSESTRQNLGRGAMTFSYDGLDNKGRAKVYMGQKLLLLEMDNPTKFEYPYWEGGGTITLISPPSVDEHGKNQVYVEVQGDYLVRKWP